MTFNMLANNYVLCTVVLESLIIIMFSMAVNKNLVGFGVGAGRLSTDQKKKLLWGNKKSNPPESSAHWDSNLFPDRERQEKFNKLMVNPVPQVCSKTKFFRCLVSLSSKVHLPFLLCDALTLF
jgi:hypothetical protein